MKKLSLFLMIALFFNSSLFGLNGEECEHIVFASTGGYVALWAVVTCFCCLRSCLIDKGKTPESQLLIAEKKTAELDKLSNPSKKALYCFFATSIWVAPAIFLSGFLYCSSNYYQESS